MKILVTGAAGFVGQHMLQELLRHGHDVVGTAIKSTTIQIESGPMSLSALDITNPKSCDTVLKKHKPDAIIHLAGLAHTVDTGFNLGMLFEVNVGGVANIANAFHKLKTPTQRQLLVVSSSFVYGGEVNQKTTACNESSLLSPRGYYGHSKLAAEFSARIYEGEGLNIYSVRPFNHIGPGQQSTFVVAGLAERINAAKNGDTIIAGNLAAIRDFTDVRDIVRGYRLLVEKAPTHRTFVFGSGVARTIDSVFREMCTLSGKTLKSITKDELLRSSDGGALIADARLAASVLDWRPEIPLSTSLKDALMTHNERKVIRS